MKMPRRMTVILTLSSLAAAAILLFSPKPVPVLTVATWTGDYGLAQKSTQMSVFAQTSGADVRFAVYDGGTDQIARQVQARTVTWDVVDMELADAVAACRAGLLEKIQPPNGDFIAGALGPCYVATAVYSRVAAFDPAHFSGAKPQTLSDVFDTARFVGGRVLADTPKGNLEMALLADGVAPRDVYRVLATPAGVARAFAKLDTIKASLIWPTGNESAVSLLSSGKAAFAVVLNGDLAAAVGSGRSLSAIWDGQVYAFDVLAIPKGSAHVRLASDYIRFATADAALGAFASWVPYGPPRLSARALIGKNPQTGAMMTDFQPTAGNRLSRALALDEAWWLVHGAGLDAAWRKWRAASSPSAVTEPGGL